MASSSSVYASMPAPKSPKSRVAPKRAKRSKCLISVKAKKNYETLKTGLRHFLASEAQAPGFAATFTLALNEATACEMEDSLEEADKTAKREERKAEEAKAAAVVA